MPNHSKLFRTAERIATKNKRANASGHQQSVIGAFLGVQIMYNRVNRAVMGQESNATIRAATEELIAAAFALHDAAS